MDNDIRKLPTIGGCRCAATILSGYRGTCTEPAQCAACVLLTRSRLRRVLRIAMQHCGTGGCRQRWRCPGDHFKNAASRLQARIWLFRVVTAARIGVLGGAACKQGRGYSIMVNNRISTGLFLEAQPRPTRASHQQLPS